jgi:hypothetical protein
MLSQAPNGQKLPLPIGAGSGRTERRQKPEHFKKDHIMTTFILCWHKPPSIEGVERGRIDKEWLKGIAWGRLDVLKLKGGKPYLLGSCGGWSRLQRQKAAVE